METVRRNLDETYRRSFAEDGGFDVRAFVNGIAFQARRERPGIRVEVLEGEARP